MWTLTLFIFSIVLQHKMKAIASHLFKNILFFFVALKWIHMLITQNNDQFAVHAVIIAIFVMESIVMRRGAVTNVFAPDLICIYLFIPLVLLQDRFMEHRPWSLNCNVSLSVKHQNSEDQGKYYSVSKGSISSSILCPWGWCWSYR